MLMAVHDKNLRLAYTFEILQGSRIVATVSETDLVIARQKATHLAIAYSQVGPEPVTVRGVGGIRLQD
jgi:hypothetical protein